MSLLTVTKSQSFRGDKKHLIHFLVPFEKKFLKAALPWVPGWLNTAQLTLMTVLWSVTVALSGYLAQGNIQWMWLFSAAILMQYITDMLDGEVGRSRNSGLIKWGFYMDHFLDYVFLCSIVTGYSFLLPVTYGPLTLLCLTFTAGFMVHTFMDFSITHNFKISCNEFGVSEARMLLVFFNILLIVFGPGLLVKVFPFFVGLAFVGLCALVYNSQKIYRHLDTLKQAQNDEVETNHGKPFVKIF
jgi:phosphatidylglycerophosphate synthase